jgi:hypothetical protein
MAPKLDFKALDQVVENNPTLSEARTRRWGRREANPTIQMSVRMREDVYDRFRALAETERRTNGEMLEILLEHWVSCDKAKV